MSKLSEGNWLKISVSETGIHFIPADVLRKWGFPDPEKVTIHGYGGRQLPDCLLLEKYIDDLPEIQSHITREGIYFYAIGPVEFEINSDKVYERKRNPYSDKGYYFITDSRQSTRGLGTTGLAAKSGETSSVFMYPLLHELDAVNYGSTGQVFLGEDFRQIPSRNFSFTLAEREENSDVNVKINFATRTTSDSYLSFSANGNTISGFDRVVIPQTYSSNYGVIKQFDFMLEDPGDKLNLGLSFVGGGIVKSANLDYILVNYSRRISIPQIGSIEFHTDSKAITIGDGIGEGHLWDVTDDLRISELNSLLENGERSSIVDNSGLRKYVCWSEGSILPQPEAVSKVENQNLHDAALAPQMVIFSGSSLQGQANEIAELHRMDDGMDVTVVLQDKIFNEFSSGVRDPGAFRKYLKMLWDRNPGRLQYALFLGRGSYDNRGLTRADNNEDILMPVWESEESMTETVSYTTDDFFSQLEDNAGVRPESDAYCISVGRIPARSVAEAKQYVAKLKEYVAEKEEGEWLNRIIVLADDGDLGVHLTQAENEVVSFQSTSGGQSKLYEKIYLDAYGLKSGVCVEARDLLHQQLERGSLWWNYNGHANKYYLSGQGVMTLNDIENLNNRKYPIFFGATCYFLQWDGNEQSGAEKLLFNERGGIIAGITATRPVFISENGYLASALAEEALTEDSGKYQTIGESLRKAKNKLASPARVSNANKLRFCLMGDPAIRPKGSSGKVKLDSIDSEVVSDNTIVALQGRNKYTFKGSISGLDGKKAEDFSGRINLSFYDADKSVTTKGRDIDGTKGKQMTFDSHGDLLFVGTDTIIDGRWEMNVVIPEDISDNFRPASVLLYAEGKSGEVSSLIRSIYVSGINDSGYTDTIPPVIESIYLNEASFKNGDRVNSSPVLFVKVTDDTGINLSMSGIGKNMQIRVDNKTYDDVSMYYTPNIGANDGGEIVYPLDNLTEGEHRLKFRVSDLSGNIAEKEIAFVVDDKLLPEILDIYTDVNPATSDVNFYLSHNRPDALLTITISVYSLSGNLVWSQTATDRSNLLVSSPISWNLIDRGGNRVSRGIYIYRAEVLCEGKRVMSPAKRLAVTGR